MSLLASNPHYTIISSPNKYGLVEVKNKVTGAKAFVRIV